MKRILFLSFFAFTAIIFGCELTQSEKEFVQEHLVSEETKKILDEHNNGQLIDFIRSYEPKWLEGYYIKWDPTRIMGAYILKKSIENNKCLFLEVPQKYCYPLKPTINDLEEDVLIISKKIEHGPQCIITLTIAQELVAVVEDTAFRDFAKGNVIWTLNGTLAFVDTEAVSFEYYNKINVQTYKNYINAERHKGLLSLENFMFRNGATPEALEFVQARIKWHKQRNC